MSQNTGLQLTYRRYSAAKQYLLSGAGLKDDIGTHFLSSLVAGTVATTICAPADVLKSRIQSAAAAPGGKIVRRRRFHVNDRIHY